MAEKEEIEFQSFERDVRYMVDTLAQSFESTDAEFYLDELNQILYVKLEGLDEYSEEEIEEIAAPVFEIIDLDFEEIVLLPL